MYIVSKAISFSNNSFPHYKHVCMLSHFSHVRFCATLWTVARQAPLSIGFSRQEYWSGLPCSPTGDLPNPGIEPASFMSPALASGFFTPSATWEALYRQICPNFFSNTKLTQTSPSQITSNFPKAVSLSSKHLQHLMCLSQLTLSDIIGVGSSLFI